MTTVDAYQERCEQLFRAGGNAAVRRAAQEGLDEHGPHPDLYCWLALGHAAEDEDDHDDRAEEAFRAGLALDADHVGLLAGYAELCLRADAFDHPGRAARARVLARRLDELAPDSPEAAQVAAAERWERRSYLDEVRMAAATAAVGHATEIQARTLEADLRQGTAAPAEATVDRDAIVRAAVRFLGRHRTAAWTICGILCVLTNTVLRQTGVVDSFSLWGALWAVPLLIVDRRFTAVRKEAESRHIAALEASFADRG
jgi:hypothetical protein